MATPASAVDYDAIAIVPFASRLEPDGRHWMLSLDERRHLRVSTLVKSLLDQFDGSPLEVVAEKLQQACPGVSCSRADVQHVVDEFLVPHGLIAGTAVPLRPTNSASSLWWHVPLLHTDDLRALVRLASVLYLRWPVRVATSVATIVVGVSVALIAGVLPAGQSTGMSPALFIALLYLSLFAHEVGHVSAAHHYGVRCGRAGVGLYLFFPVFYVDLTNAWRLPARERVIVDLGGAYFQMLAVLPLGLAAAVARDPAWSRNFLIACLIAALNLLPFLRMDGYWALSDGLGIANLASNARRWLIEAIKGRRPRPAVLVASFTYVLSTGIGIALSVYLTIRSILHWEAWSTSFGDVASRLRAGDWSGGVEIANGMFIYVMPPLFIVVSVLRGMILGKRRTRRS